MTESITRDLDEIGELTVIGKYHEAIRKIDKILKKDRINESEKIRALILKCKSLERLGNFEVENDYFEKSCKLSSLAFDLSKEINDLISKVESKVWFLSAYYRKMDFNPKVYLEEIKAMEDIYEEIKRKEISLPKEIEASISIVLSYQNRAKIMTDENFIWDHKETFIMLEKAQKLILECENKEYLMLLLGTKAYLNREINEYDKALKFYEEALNLAEEIGNEHYKSFYLYEIGGTYWSKGEYNLLLEYQLKALEIREKQGNERGVGQVYNRIGIYYAELGEFKQALEYFQKAYDILSEGGKRESYIYFLANIGVINYTLGYLDEALNCFETAYKVNKKLGLLEYAYRNLENIRANYFRRGEFDKALELNQEVLAYKEKTSDQRGIANSVFFLGSVYAIKGNFNKALEYFENYLNFIKELNIKTEIANMLYYLVSFTSEFSKLDLAREYYTQLIDIIEEIDYKNYKKLALAAEAIILKNSDTQRDRVKAEVLLEQLLLEEFSHWFLIEILFQLCNLLLGELKLSSDEKILSKLQKHVDKLIEIGTTSKLPNLIVESLWFKAQLSLLNLDFDRTRELLNQALSTAEDKGYNFLALKMMKSKEELINQTMDLEETVRNLPTISKRMDAIKIENGFKKITSSEMFQLKQNI